MATNVSWSERDIVQLSDVTRPTFYLLPEKAERASGVAIGLQGYMSKRQWAASYVVPVTITLEQQINSTTAAALWPKVLCRTEAN